MANINNLYSPGAVSYRPGMRFKNMATDSPGPGSYDSPLKMNSSFERVRNGRWGTDRKKDMVLRNSVGKQSFPLNN